MTLREGVCTNRHMEEGVWPNHHISFIVAKKSLIYSLFSSNYSKCGGRGLAENVRIPSYGEEGV